MVALFVQPLLSVTVTVYVAAHNEFIVLVSEAEAEVVAPVDHTYV